MAQTIQNMLITERDRMRDILQNGIEGDFVEFLEDYSRDFALTTAAPGGQYSAMLADAEWLSLADQIKQTHGYDFISEIKAAIEAEPSNTVR